MNTTITTGNVGNYFTYQEGVGWIHFDGRKWKWSFFEGGYSTSGESSTRKLAMDGIGHAFASHKKRSK